MALQADLKKKSCQEEALKKENELLKEDARKRNEEYEEEIRQVNETKNCLQLRLLEETQSKDQLRSDLTLKNEALQNRVVAAQDHGTEAQASLNQEIKKKDDESRRLQSQLDKLRGESSQKLQAKENELRGRQEELKKVREQVRLRESEMKSLRSQVEDAVRMEKLADKKRKAELAISGELRSAVKTTAQEMDTVKTALAEMGHKLQPAFEQLANVHGQLEARLSNEAPASGVPATEKEHFKAVLQNVQEGVRALVAENSSIKEDLKRKGLENQEATRVAHEQVMERLTVQQSLEEIEKKVSTLEAEKRRLEEQLDSGKNNKTTLIARLQQDKRLVDTAFDNLDVSFPAAEKKSSGMQKEPEHAKGSGQMLSPAPLEDDDLPPNPKPRRRLKKLSPPQKASKDTGGPSKRQKQPSLVRRKKRRSAASVPVGDSRKNNRRPSPDDDQDMFDDDQKMSNPQSDR